MSFIIGNDSYTIYINNIKCDFRRLLKSEITDKQLRKYQIFFIENNKDNYLRAYQAYSSKSQHISGQMIFDMNTVNKKVLVGELYQFSDGIVESMLEHYDDDGTVFYVCDSLINMVLPFPCQIKMVLGNSIDATTLTKAMNRATSDRYRNTEHVAQYIQPNVNSFLRKGGVKKRCKKQRATKKNCKKSRATKRQTSRRR